MILYIPRDPSHTHHTEQCKTTIVATARIRKNKKALTVSDTFLKNRAFSIIYYL